MNKPKKRGWPKGKPRGPRKPKLSYEELFAKAAQASENVDPFKTRSIPKKSEQPISPVLSPFYGKMSKQEILVLVELLKRSIESL